MSDFPQIPGYRIERELGRGGMAVVYLAHEEKLDRLVALKVLELLSAQGRDLAERFVREARTAAKLQHSNIVSIFDVGQARNIYYMAVEYLSEGTLRDRIVRGPLAPHEALRIVEKLADALSYAHSQGFIHRDVKPENIMFRRDGNPVLTDFGIARAVDSATRLTKTGMSIGTPHYMSPEQARGKKLDGRADFYSLGIVLYELLTGKVPFDAEDSVAIAIMHIQEPIPELPPRLLRFHPLLERMMAKEREARVQSGTAFLRLVQELEGAGAGRAGAPGVASHAQRRGIDEDAMKEGKKIGQTAEKEETHKAKKPTPRQSRIPAIGNARPGEEVFSYGMRMKPSDKSPARSRNILIGVLGGALVVTVGILILLLNKGERKVVVKPSHSLNEGSAVSERPDIPSVVKPHESGARSTYEEEQEERYKGYLAQAEKFYEAGDYERSKSNAELAGGIRRSDEVRDLEGRIRAAIKRQTDAAAEKDRVKKALKQREEQARADDWAWEIATRLGTEDAFQTYLAGYPTGKYVSDAQHRIKAIREAASVREEDAGVGSTETKAEPSMPTEKISSQDTGMNSYNLYSIKSNRGEEFDIIVYINGQGIFRRNKYPIVKWKDVSTITHRKHPFTVADNYYQSAVKIKLNDNNTVELRFRTSGSESQGAYNLMINYWENSKINKK